MDETNNTEETTESNFITKEQLDSILENFKKDTAGMVSGAVNRATKESKSLLESKFEGFQETLNKLFEQKPQEIIPEEQPKKDTTETPDNSKLSIMEQMIQKLETRLKEQEQENQRIKEENERVNQNNRRNNTKSELIKLLQDKDISDPDTLLGSLEKVHNLISFKDNPEGEKGSFVFTETNQFGEIVEIPFEEKIDNVIKEKFSYMVRERPGNGLSSQQPQNQSKPTGRYQSNELSSSLLTAADPIQELLKDL